MANNSATVTPRQATDGESQATATPAECVCEAGENKQEPVKEIGGPKGLEPTRYGDWEKGGRCIDF